MGCSLSSEAADCPLVDNSARWKEFILRYSLPPYSFLPWEPAVYYTECTCNICPRAVLLGLGNPHPHSCSLLPADKPPISQPVPIGVLRLPPSSFTPDLSPSLSIFVVFLKQEIENRRHVSHPLPPPGPLLSVPEAPVVVSAPRKRGSTPGEGIDGKSDAQPLPS